MPVAKKGNFQYLIEGLKSTNREEKLISILALGILRISQHANLLVDLLASPDEEIVEQVIIALGRIGNPDSVKYILEFISSDKEKLTRTAISVLQQMNLLPAISFVLQAASSDQPNEIRKKVIDLLIDYEDVRVASLMNEILAQTRDHNLLVAAIKYFIRYPNPERHTALKMLANNSNWEVALAANLALSRLKDEGAYSQVRRLAKSGNPEIRQFIVDSINKYPLIEDRNIYQMFFEDSRSSIRKAALKGLEFFGADERIAILRRWLTRETDKELKKLLLKRASKERSILFYDEFYHNLNSSDEEIRKMIIDSIADMGEKVLDRIINDFNHMPLVIKEQMILALGKIGGDKVVKLIEESLEAKERWLRINAVEAASFLCNDALYQKLIELLQHKATDVWVRATVVSALGRSRKHEFADIVASQIYHEDARVRANAIEALDNLAWLGLPEACHKLIHDCNDRVRINAAIALWKSGHEEVFAELEKMSNDKSHWVRLSAIFALSQIKASNSTRILLNMLSDSEEIVYKNVVEALAKSGDIHALLPLLKESRQNRLPPAVFAEILQNFSQAIYE